MSVVPIGSAAEFDQFLTQGGQSSPRVVLFYATWYDPCKQMLTLVGELAQDYPAIAFSIIDADRMPDLAKRFAVVSAPTTVILKGDAEVQRVTTADVKSVAAAVSKVAVANSDDRSDQKPDLQQLVNRSSVMLFMKGSPDRPQCGFSAKLVSLLKSKNIEFGHFDILNDERVRQELKLFANWKTYPQLWIHGQFVGGLDIALELEQAGELDEMLKVD